MLDEMPQGLLHTVMQTGASIKVGNQIVVLFDWATISTRTKVNKSMAKGGPEVLEGEW